MRKRRTDPLEARRLQAYRLYRRGWTQRLIAEALGVTEGAVSQWINRAKLGGGKRALYTQPRSGRPLKLSPNQIRSLLAVIDRGASRYGFLGDFWSAKRIAQVAREKWAINLHPSTITRLLKSHRRSYQAPIRRAKRRDEEAIEQWRTKKWPALKKKPGVRDERSYS